MSKESKNDIIVELVEEFFSSVSGAMTVEDWSNILRQAEAKIEK